ncbi:MAG TPA: hypothetical protein PLR06_10545, partial [Cyclobacteriaceae bacterium]|nr:hypothetical protein [Cyclobacteriaceae bacterium]
FMAGYFFSNNYSITQGQATSTVYPTQVQPAFSVTGSGNVGLLAEFGAEVRLTSSIYFIANVGGRGIDIGGSLGKPTLPSYGSGYQQPTDFDGSFFLSYNAGLKYYFGKGKKKRDF